MIAGEGKYTAVNSKARSPCLLVFISQVVNYCAAGIIPGQWSPVGQRKIFQVLALCSVPTFLDHATAALGQGQSRAVLPRLGPCQQLRPPRARCVTKYSQIAAGPRGGLDMSHGPLSKMPECLEGSRHNGTALVWHTLWYVADFGVCHMELVVASFS